MPKLFLLSAIFLLFSFSGESPQKRISDENYRYEFFTTDKDITPDEGKVYYWYKGGKIHSSEEGIAGELLAGAFIKYYHTNQLAEAGIFKNGLRDGYWKSWYQNGLLQSKIYWNKGLKNGNYYSYDQTGFLTEQGKYRNGEKNGTWINYIVKDTLTYKDGKIKQVKERAAKPAKDSISTTNKKGGFLKSVFGKNHKSTAGKIDKATPVTEVKEKKNFFSSIFTKNRAPVSKTTKPAKGEKNPDTAKKKPGFFKKLFTKKNKNNSNE